MEKTDAVVPSGATTCGAKAHAAIRVDFAEHDRRAQLGLGGLDRATINAMFSLPHGHWIRWDDIAPGLAKFLRRLPDGIVELTAHGVRRLVSPPVTVGLAVVTGLPWSAGLTAAGAFAPFCRRALLLDRRRRLPRDKIWEADYWGIGVWTLTAGGIEELLPPALWVQRYVKPAGWAFRERAYDTWLGAAGLRPLGGPPDLFGPGGITRESSTTDPDDLTMLEQFLVSRAFPREVE